MSAADTALSPRNTTPEAASGVPVDQSIGVLCCVRLFERKQARSRNACFLSRVLNLVQIGLQCNQAGFEAC